VNPCRSGILLLSCVFGLGFSLPRLTAEAPELGKPSPAITIQRVGSPPITLNRYRGKVVALAFIHTTCPHCQDLTAVLVPIAKEYAPRGVQFLECAFNSDVQALLPQFIEKFQPPFPVGWADYASVMAYFGRTISDQEIFYVPHMVFLDRRGMVRGDFPGESGFFRDPNANIRAELDKLLKGAAAGRKK